MPLISQVNKRDKGMHIWRHFGGLLLSAWQQKRIHTLLLYAQVHPYTAQLVDALQLMEVMHVVKQGQDMQCPAVREFFYLKACTHDEDRYIFLEKNKFFTVRVMRF